jgi:hypothetical protein
MVNDQQWADARERFMAQRSGTTDGDPNIQLLAAALVHVPAILDTVNALHSAWAEGSLEHWARTTPVAQYAYDYAGTALNVAVDGLTGIYALVVLGEALPTFSVLTLARQANEGSLRSRWILGDLTADGLVRRGFAAAWEEAHSQRTHTLNAIDYGLIASEEESASRQKVSDRIVKLTSEGRAHRLLKRNSKGAWVPDLQLPSMTDLFKNMVGAHTGPKGNHDMRWMYSLLSGVAHGRTWAAMAGSVANVLEEYIAYTDNGIASTGNVNARTDPNTLTIALAVQVGLFNTIEAIGDVQSGRDLPGPSRG